MSYNITQLLNVTTVGELTRYVDAASGNILLSGLVIGIFFIQLIYYRRWGFDVALLTSSGTTFLVSSILAYGQFISMWYPLVLLFLFIMIVLYTYGGGKKN
jgi:uncharacterized membrane protein (UPF0136 family)